MDGCIETHTIKHMIFGGGSLNSPTLTMDWIFSGGHR